MHRMIGTNGNGDRRGLTVLTIAQSSFASLRPERFALSSMEEGVPTRSKPSRGLNEHRPCGGVGRTRRRMSRDAGTAGNMPNAQTALHSPAPGANKSVVQRASYNRAGERNQTANPFLRRFLSQLESQPFRDAGRQPLENLFFGKVLAVIDARGCCSGHPQLQPFALTVVL